MKNDLDFIKDKIANSGVKAPEDMDEAYVARTLEGVTPQPAVINDPPKRKRRAVSIAVSSIAASLVLVITLGIVLHGFVRSSNNSLALPGGLALRRFESRDQIAQEITRLNKKSSVPRYSGLFNKNTYVEDDIAAGDVYAAEDGSKTGSSGGSSNASGGSDRSASYSETYKQVEGVDEADIIKTDGRYIYCVDKNYSDKNAVVIFSAEGENSQKVAEIDVYDDAIISTPDEATPDEADRWEYYYDDRSIENIYLNQNRLIVLYNDDTGYDGYAPGKAAAKIYDVSNIKHIRLLDTFTQSGTHDASRMIGDTLYLVSSYYARNDTEIPACGSGDDLDELPADQIYCMDDNDSGRFLVLSAVDTLDGFAKTESKSILGAVDDIYCNEDHLYIYTTHRQEKWYSGFWGDEVESVQTTSRILKVDLTDDIAFTAYAEIPGVIDDQYALDEYQGNLRVATTTSVNWVDTNNLFVLDDQLSVIGAVAGFADNEQIKAVRYVGDTAYVITYEQTDPLFVIDLSDPKEPAILGEVKISGFSTMLVPIDENTILGIGYHTSDGTFSDMEVQDGVKLVLFDVSDKANPKVLDSLVYANYNSEVQYNPKALVYNPDRNDYIIPMNYAYYGSVVDDAEAYWSGEEFYGGVLNFKVENNQLVEIGRYQADYSEVERCVYVGDTVYMTYHDYSDYSLQIDSVPYQK